jgi:perosamine synthetase
MNDKKGRGKRIPLARPHLTASARANIDRVFDENFYSQGFFNTEFEEAFAKYHGVKYATTCSNGTAALWLALKAFGIGSGDEVIVPTLTFAATIGAVIEVGATPILVDSRESDGTISPKEVKKAITPRTKAVIPVDLYGLSADYDELKRIISGTNIVIIQDAAEALGGTYKGKPIGTQGSISCFSFYGNKIIITGEGGMCLTDSKELYDAMVLYKNHGTGNRPYWVEVPGFNMRMTNLQAGIGVSQFADLPAFLAERYKIFEMYQEMLKDVDGVEFLPFNGQTYGPWMVTIHVRGFEKEEVVKMLDERDIETRPGFFPLHLTPAFSPYAKEQEYPVAESFSRHLINLPTYIGLATEDIQRVADALKEIVTNA